MHKRYLRSQSAFTIVELLIVIVIIAILAAITVVAYNGVQARAVKTALQSDLRNAATKVALDKAEKGTYPTDQSAALALFTPAAGTHYEYSTPDGGVTYLMTITSDKAGIPAYCQKSDGSLTEGACPGHSATAPVPIAAIQTITAANCPTTRTVTFDKRDNRTYWVQKLADGKCWMLTNLAYAGGGDNTYNDVRALTNGTGGATTRTVPSYYANTGTSYTTNPTNPSTDTTGSDSSQFGYFYNWCGAMGAQTSTAACANASTPAPNTNISACAAGWRLPTGGPSSEFEALNNAVNGGSTNNDAGLRTNWLGQKGGSWFGGFSGGEGNYWSATAKTGDNDAVYRLTWWMHATNPASSYVYSNISAAGKSFGFAVRCVAI